MKIKTVEITGFKSFMEHTVFPLDQGITAVVGPNGCGKSNLVDAIRWALGEQSAKHLRGQAMEDVIFNGSESHAPMSMAEVTLTFRNDEGQVPDLYKDYVEIAVTRRLFRSGESDYLINKVPVRLKDVTDLFLGTGVGTKAYSIIEQGRVGLIVNARPEDRRNLIEEAAGVSKYRVKKKQAERKMEATRQNLQRIEDILGEVTRQIRSLERQAKKAERYKRVRDEAKGIELRGAAHEALRMFAEVHAIEESCTAAREKLVDLERDLVAREGNLAAAKLDETARDGALQELDRKLYEADNELKLCERDQAHLAREIEAGEARQKDVAGEIAAAEAAAEQNETARAEVDASFGACAAEHEARFGELAEATGTATRLEEKWGELKVCIDRLREEEARANEAIVRAKSQIGAMERQRGEFGGRLETLVETESGERRVADDETARRDAVNGAVSGLRQLRLELGGKEDELRQRANEIQARVTARETEIRELWSRLSERKSRLEALVAIYESHEGVGEGARRLLARANQAGQVSGVRGLVADLIEVPAGLEAAAAAVLGPRLEYLVTESDAAARSMMAELRGESLGRAGFIVLDSAAETASDSGPAQPSSSAALPEGWTFVRDAIGANGNAKAFAHLFGRVVLVDEIPDRAILSDDFAAFTFVSRAGDVAEPNGVYWGGSGMEAGGGLLVRRREIRELREEVSRLWESHDARKAEQAADERELVDLTGHLSLVREAARVRDQDISKEERELSRIEAEVAKHTTNLDRTRKERQAVEARIGELVAQIDAECRTLVDAERARGERQADLREVVDTERTARVEFEAARERQTALRVQVTALAERRDSLSRELARLSAALGEAKARCERAEHESVRLAETVSAHREQLAATGEKLSACRIASAALAEARVGADAMLREIVEAVNEIEISLRDVRAQIDTEKSTLTERGFQKAQTGLELKQLSETLQTKWKAPLAHAIAEYHMAPIVDEPARARLAELLGIMERMGEVNLSAMDEYADLQKRQEFLTTQRDDLRQSLLALQRAIAKINHTSRERFRETFELVNARFQEVFPRLFRGGRAKLALTDENDMLETGVEIIAQPPGRKLQHLTLLSGGEKALTAVSLLFALFLVRPTPFCLLDEVDAPLDDANVDRFSAMVREMSTNGQFIIISHSRVTMECADRLIGITMEEPGISKLVTVELKDEATLAMAG
ncbi:MAG: chromosome segregation protein SMC [Deltaproteobacteria bacterium]|nr:chromosome segregation protein SMC [Deltaproteobacteria bacterium]